MFTIQDLMTGVQSMSQSLPSSLTNEGYEWTAPSGSLYGGDAASNTATGLRQTREASVLRA